MGLHVSQIFYCRTGVEYPSHYIRIEATICECGKKVIIKWKDYVSKTLFKAKGAPILPKDNNIFRKIEVDYDKLNDGTDIVSVAHDKLVDYLTTSQGTDNEGNPLPPVYALENVSIVDL